jgi:uncharacterized protein YfiM (DUF2279 family)
MIESVLAAALLLGCAERNEPFRESPGVILAAAMASAPASPGRDDPWLGQDKARHFALSFAATAFAYAGARFVAEPEPARLVAASAAIAAGVGKEVHDARAGWGFSFRDMVWNVAGVGLGLVLVGQVR